MQFAREVMRIFIEEIPEKHRLSDAVASFGQNELLIQSESSESSK